MMFINILGRGKTIQVWHILGPLRRLFILSFHLSLGFAGLIILTSMVSCWAPTSFTHHIFKTVLLAAQSIYAIKAIKSYGVHSAPSSLTHIWRSTFVSPVFFKPHSAAWCDCLMATDKDGLQNVFNHAARWGLHGMFIWSYRGW